MGSTCSTGANYVFEVYTAAGNAQRKSDIRTGSAVGFAYTPEHNRYKQCIGGCTSPTTTIIYANDPISGAGSEKSITGSTNIWNDYITVDGHIVAEHINAAGVQSMKYFVLDDLGSTVALTDTTGNVAERDYYDAWGKRRNSDGSADTTCSLTSAISAASRFVVTAGTKPPGPPLASCATFAAGHIRRHRGS